MVADVGMKDTYADSGENMSNSNGGNIGAGAKVEGGKIVDTKGNVNTIGKIGASVDGVGSKASSLGNLNTIVGGDGTAVLGGGIAEVVGTINAMVGVGGKVACVGGGLLASS